MESLEELFEEQLKDVYYAEKLILRNLPKLAKKVTSKELKSAFLEHTEQTKTQLERLEQVFGELGKKAKGKRCAAMEGLVAEAEELMEEAEASAVRDAGLLVCAQAVEHYEIARYGALSAWAHKLGEKKIAKLLEQTLAEEKETDAKLTKLAESEINVEADVASEKKSQSRRGESERSGARVRS
jgi:ferritin-like metal-binding protein YciE